jgi:hypothetical protein
MRWMIASSNARSSSRGVAISATSRRVRVGAVTGMPRCISVSSGASDLDRWTISPGRRRFDRGTVTWIGSPAISTSRHSHAADQ